MAAIALQKRMTSQHGTNIMVAGIAFQLLSMIIFSSYAVDFVTKAQAKGALKIGTEKANRGMRRMIRGLSIGSICILIRCVCEYSRALILHR